MRILYILRYDRLSYYKDTIDITKELFDH